MLHQFHQSVEICNLNLVGQNVSNPQSRLGIYPPLYPVDKFIIPQLILFRVQMQMVHHFSHSFPFPPHSLRPLSSMAAASETGVTGPELIFIDQVISPYHSLSFMPCSDSDLLRSWADSERPNRQFETECSPESGVPLADQCSHKVWQLKIGVRDSLFNSHTIWHLWLRRVCVMTRRMPLCWPRMITNAMWRSQRWLFRYIVNPNRGVILDDKPVPVSIPVPSNWLISPIKVTIELLHQRFSPLHKMELQVHYPLDWCFSLPPSGSCDERQHCGRCLRRQETNARDAEDSSSIGNYSHESRQCRVSVEARGKKQGHFLF